MPITKDNSQLAQMIMPCPLTVGCPLVLKASIRHSVKVRLGLGLRLESPLTSRDVWKLTVIHGILRISERTAHLS